MGHIDRDRLTEALGREEPTYRDTHPRSRAAVAANEHMMSGVPMTWMAKWAGGFPLVHDSAAGHSPPPTVAAIERRAAVRGGLTTMLPTDLLTPFHTMALMCPATTAHDVDVHTGVFADVVGAVAAR